MSGKPKETRTIAMLHRRAMSELSDDATALDYVVYFIAGGKTFADLAVSLAAEMGESVSRQHVSGTAHALEDDAKERIAAARRDGALAMVDDTITIADDAEPTSGGAAKARLQIAARQWSAERFNAEVLGPARPQLSINIGTLLLDALRQPPPPPPVLDAAMRVLSSGAIGDEGASTPVVEAD